MRILRAFGIDVHLHWAWVFILVADVWLRYGKYDHVIWNVIEIVSLFGIVLLHEFGHALACRSVGGSAHTIMLWPLGGIAYVRPPARPGALLWSIAAGPLVNVLLVPVTVGVFLAVRATLPGSSLELFTLTMAAINVGLLVFNVLPVYPLDGGQILRALLWFMIGRDRSLSWAARLGLVAALAAVVLAVVRRDLWMGLLAWYAARQSWRGLEAARANQRVAALPHHDHLACPRCGNAPLAGPLWECSSCGGRFDMFTHDGTCPDCGAQYQLTRCHHCGQDVALREYRRTGTPEVENTQSKPDSFVTTTSTH